MQLRKSKRKYSGRIEAIKLTYNKLRRLNRKIKTIIKEWKELEYIEKKSSSSK